MISDPIMTMKWLVGKLEDGWIARQIADDRGCCLGSVTNYMRKYGLKSPPGFWSTPGAQIGRPPGFKHTDKWRQGMSEKYTGEGNPFWGKKHSATTREQMSKNHADFNGDKNPFYKAWASADKEKRDEYRSSTIQAWVGKDRRCASDMARSGKAEISGTTWAGIRGGAKDRSLIFDITIGEVLALFYNQDRKCALSGIDLIMDERNGDRTASLDRIDSNGGYTIDNVQWVHKDINMAKRRMSNDEFVAMCSLVAENNFQTESGQTGYAKISSENGLP